MKSWLKYSLIILLIGLPAFFLGPVLWHPSGDIQPTAAQLPFYILLAVIEAAVFGYGIAYMYFNWQPKKASFWAISWFLISWWPHDNLHIHNGVDPAGLLLIEYGFHVTLIIAAIIISYEWAKKR